MRQRKTPQTLDPFIRRERHLRWKRSNADLQFVHFLHQWNTIGWPQNKSETKLKGQQVAHRNRALRRNRPVQGPVRPLQDFSIRQFWQQTVYRFIESHIARFDQHHRGDRCNRFCHRRNAENRVPLYFLTAFATHRAHSKRGNVSLLASADQRHESWNVSPPCIAAHLLVQFAQPSHRQLLLNGSCARPEANQRSGRQCLLHSDRTQTRRRFQKASATFRFLSSAHSGNSLIRAPSRRLFSYCSSLSNSSQRSASRHANAS